jgi:hypothetical protein
VFTPAQSVRYLELNLKALAPRSPGILSEAAELAAELGYLPLALSHASAVIADAGITCAEYRDLLHDKLRTLADVMPKDPAPAGSGYPPVLPAAWSLAVDVADALKPRQVAPALLADEIDRACKEIRSLLARENPVELSKVGTLLDQGYPRIKKSGKARKKQLKGFLATHIPELVLEPREYGSDVLHPGLPRSVGSLPAAAEHTTAAVAAAPSAPTSADTHATSAASGSRAVPPGPAGRAARPALPDGVTQGDIERVRSAAAARLREHGGKLLLSDLGQVIRDISPAVQATRYAGTGRMTQFVAVFLGEFRFHSDDLTGGYLTATAPRAPAARPAAAKPRATTAAPAKTGAKGAAQTSRRGRRATAGTSPTAGATGPVHPADLDKARTALLKELANTEALPFSVASEVIRQAAPRLRQDGYWAGEPSLKGFFTTYLNDFQLEGHSVRAPRRSVIGRIVRGLSKVVLDSGSA